MTGFFDGAADVLAHLIVLGSIFGAAYAADRVAVRRRHEREFPAIVERERARQATSPRTAR